jgi:hypothetical protein
MGAARKWIPDSLASDPSDLSLALAEARELWERGERDDALRSVRRAIDAAHQAGQAFRVLALTQAFDSLCEARVQPQPVSNVRPTPRKTLPGVAPSARAPSRAAAVSVPPPPHSTVVPTSARVGSVTMPSAPLRPPPVPQRVNENRVRVSVRVSVRDPDLLVVRKLATGAPVPAGAREAFLVIPDAESVQ